MPKLFGLNPIAIIAASIAFYFVGFLIYGVFFVDLWMQVEGVDPVDAQGADPGRLLLGFMITVPQVIGLGLVLKWRDIQNVAGAVVTALALWAVFGLMLMAYDTVYIPGYSAAGLFIDGLHILLGWLLASVVLTIIK